MNLSLTDRIQNYLTPEDAGYLALLLDEPPNAIEEAWSAIAPLLLQTAHHQVQTTAGADAIHRWMQEYADPTAFPEAGVFMRSDAFPDWIAQHTTLASRFFGPDAFELMDRIGQWAGLRADSVGMLMTAAIPGFLGDLGRLMAAQEGSGGDLKSWLDRQEEAPLPEDLAVGDLETSSDDLPENPLLPVAEETAAATPSEQVVPETAAPTWAPVPEGAEAPPRKKLIGSAMGILAIVVLLLLAFLLWQRLR